MRRRGLGKENGNDAGPSPEERIQAEAPWQRIGKRNKGWKKDPPLWARIRTRGAERRNGYRCGEQTKKTRRVEGRMEVIVICLNHGSPGLHLSHSSFPSPPTTIVLISRL
ncbi:uncharacterized protein LOC129356985 [Poeciliopsis prolifica]|uniref:uncharacterized protein LOC129356985 n=1 Tax=Poeciliopsis prolifica TaxID=188132 RepID=UPI00241343C9|nr:uncharacterized protein LOC129356985 [Poeciliopsis prolifica]